MLGDIAYNIDTKTFLDLDPYGEDMKDNGHGYENWDIAKVYDGLSILRSYASGIESRLLWKRKEEMIFDMGSSWAKMRDDCLIFTDGFVEIVLRDGEENWIVDFMTKFFDGTGERRLWRNDNCLTAHRDGIELLIDGKGMLIDYPNARNLLTWLKENKDVS